MILPEAGQVRPDTGDGLRAARRGAKSRNDLVENQQRARGRAHLAQRSEKPIGWRDESHVAGNRLDDDGGDLAAILVEQTLHGRRIVVARDQRVGRRRRA